MNASFLTICERTSILLIPSIIILILGPERQSFSFFQTSYLALVLIATGRKNHIQTYVKIMILCGTTRIISIKSIKYKVEYISKFDLNRAISKYHLQMQRQTQGLL